MTRKLQLPQRQYNLERLDFDLHTALPGIYLGFNGVPGALFALLEESATAEHEGQVMTIAVDHNPAQLSPDQQILRDVRSLAQSAVGVPLADLTPPQVRSLLAVLLHRAGAVNSDGTIRPLSEWGR
jgi:hypothetical protein